MNAHARILCVWVLFTVCNVMSAILKCSLLHFVMNVFVIWFFTVSLSVPSQEMPFASHCSACWNVLWRWRLRNRYVSTVMQRELRAEQTLKQTGGLVHSRSAPNLFQRHLPSGWEIIQLRCHFISVHFIFKMSLSKAMSSSKTYNWEYWPQEKLRIMIIWQDQW